MRVADARDLQGMARMFARCMARSLWAEAGGRVAHAYFSYYVTSPSAHAVVALIDGEVVGGCVGMVALDRYQYRFYRENAPRLIGAAVRDAFSNPRILVAVLRRVVKQGSLLPGRLAGRGWSYVGKPDAPPSYLPDPDRTCHMTLFCVAPEARGNRLGTRMLQRFEQDMAARGREWCLAEADADNVASRVAQERAGLECVGSSGEQFVLVGPTSDGPGRRPAPQRA